MPSVTCTTCGTITAVKSAETSAVCPECRDWLPVEKPLNAIVIPPVKPRAKLPAWVLPVCIPAAVLAVLLIIAGLGGVPAHYFRSDQPSPAAQQDSDPDSPIGFPPLPTHRRAFAIGSWTANDRPDWVNEWLDGIAPEDAAKWTGAIETLFQRRAVVAIHAQPNVLVIDKQEWDSKPREAMELLAKAVGLMLYFKGFGGRLEIRATGEFSQQGPLLATYSLRTGLKPIRP